MFLRSLRTTATPDIPRIADTRDTPAIRDTPETPDTRETHDIRHTPDILDTLVTLRSTIAALAGIVTVTASPIVTTAIAMGMGFRIGRTDSRTIVAGTEPKR